MPRGRPRDPRTRAAILAAARALLERGGLTSVTIEAIAQKAEVSRPTDLPLLAQRAGRSDGCSWRRRAPTTP